MGVAEVFCVLMVPLLATLVNVPPKALVPIIKVWPLAMVRVPLTEKSLPAVSVLAVVVLTLKLFSRLVVPGVVWSKLRVRLVVPSIVRLLLAPPINPPEVVLITPPLMVRVLDPRANFPLLEKDKLPLLFIKRLQPVASETMPDVLMVRLLRL